MTFVKGQVTNHKGRPRTPPDIIEAKRLTRNEFERVLHSLMMCTNDELEKIFNDPNTNQVTHIVIRIIQNAKLFGDHQRFAFIMDRLVGKMADNFSEEMIQVFEKVKVIRSLSHDEKMRILKQYVETEEKAESHGSESSDPGLG